MALVQRCALFWGRKTNPDGVIPLWHSTDLTQIQQRWGGGSDWRLYWVPLQVRQPSSVRNASPGVSWAPSSDEPFPWCELTAPKQWSGVQQEIQPRASVPRAGPAAQTLNLGGNEVKGLLKVTVLREIFALVPLGICLNKGFRAF